MAATTIASLRGTQPCEQPLHPPRRTQPPRAFLDLVNFCCAIRCSTQSAFYSNNKLLNLEGFG
jgi:hypothetical protein